MQPRGTARLTRALLASAALCLLLGARDAAWAAGDEERWQLSQPSGEEAAASDMLAATSSAATATTTPIYFTPTLLAATASTPLQINRLTVMGDSYSALRRKTRFRNWAEQLFDEKDVVTLDGRAKSGATASTATSNNIRPQVNKFINVTPKPTFGANDVTVMYIGYNDINTFADLTRSKADYTTFMNRLVKAGATKNGARMVVVKVHDWGKNPAQAGDPGGVYRARTQEWNTFVEGYATGKQNFVVVDMFTAFENFYADPGAYGLTNLTTPSTFYSRTTHLWDDSNHVGGKGQTLIKQVFEHYLARPAVARSAVQTSGSTATAMAQDVSASLAFNLSPAVPAETRLGLSAFAVGEPVAEEEVLAERDLTRAGFTEMYSPTADRDGGVAFNYGLSPTTSIGFVTSRYDDSLKSQFEGSSSTAAVTSDAVSMYLAHKLRGFDLLTRVSVSDDAHTVSQHDEVIDASNRARFDGRTTEVAQRAGYALDIGRAVLTPWVELSHRKQEVDDYTLANPYVNDVTYSTADVSETTAGIGFDAVGKPVALGDGASLQLFSGVFYTHSLARDDMQVSIRESGSEFEQQETVEREPVQRIGLNLGAQLDLGESFGVSAGLGFTHDEEVGSDQQASVRLSYRF